MNELSDISFEPDTLPPFFIGVDSYRTPEPGPFDQFFDPGHISGLSLLFVVVALAALLINRCDSSVSRLKLRKAEGPTRSTHQALRS